jgi:hypothetical protein
VKRNRFTRIRQIDTGSGGGPGAISYRSGSFVYPPADDGELQMIRLTYDCAWTNYAGVDAAVDNLASDAVVAKDCRARYRYGLAGVRVTLRRR